MSAAVLFSLVAALVAPLPGALGLRLVRGGEPQGSLRVSLDSGAIHLESDTGIRWSRAISRRSAGTLQGERGRTSVGPGRLLGAHDRDPRSRRSPRRLRAIRKYGAHAGDSFAAPERQNGEHRSRNSGALRHHRSHRCRGRRERDGSALERARQLMDAESGPARRPRHHRPRGRLVAPLSRRFLLRGDLARHRREPTGRRGTGRRAHPENTRGAFAFRRLARGRLYRGEPSVDEPRRRARVARGRAS